MNEAQKNNYQLSVTDSVVTLRRRGGAEAPHPPNVMAELERERVKLAKRDRKEANGLIDAVNAQDEPIVL